VGPTYTLQSFSADCQRTVNWFPQFDESGAGKSVASLFATPGLRLFTNLGGLPTRGELTTAAGRMFCACGAKVFEVFADGSWATRGELATTTGFVGMAENGKQMMLVDGANCYSFDLGTNIMSVMKFTDGSVLPGGAAVGFLDGYFVFNIPATQQFYITGQYDTTVDPLDFASAESSPDLLTTLLCDHEELWLFGTQSVEVWYNQGGELFPLARIPGAVITHGTVAAQSPVKLDNTIYWLGQDLTGTGMVWKAVGYTPQRASNHAMEQAIRKYPRIDDAVGFAYQQDGHAFYVLNFPAGNATWVLDVATSQWHERAYLGTDGLLARHRANCHTMAFGLHLVGDWENGNLYALDPTVGDDNGREIVRLRTAPYIDGELKNIFFSRLTLDMRMGLGGDGLARLPVAILTYSDDGGKTWSNERTVSLGAIGNRLARAFWNRLGRSRQRVFRVQISDNIPEIALMAAYIEFDLGSS
jgi:hypothetical protein